MTRLEKLLNRFLDNPPSLKFKKIEKLLLNLDFNKAGVRGSHYKFVHDKNKINITIPVHRNECEKIYKKEIAQLIKKHFRPY